MAMLPIYYKPGICKVNSSYASGKEVGYGTGRLGTGRYVDGSGIRFVAGFPEKLKGWTLSNSTAIHNRPCGSTEIAKPLSGVVAGNSVVLCSTSDVYVMSSINVITNITPQKYAVTSVTANTITTTISSTTVSVADPLAYLVVGDAVAVSASATVGGLTISGNFNVLTTTPGTGFTFTNPIAATASVAGGGGTVTAQYSKKLIGAGNLVVANGSQIATITYVGHGLTTGQSVWFGGTTVLGNRVDLSAGPYSATVINANSFTVPSGLFTATALVTAGGATSVGFPARTVLSTTVPGYTVAAYGQALIIGIINGTLYYVSSPDGTVQPIPIANAPSVIQAMFVTPERFVFALGISATATMTLAWPDQNDFTNWTSSAVNTANSGRSLQAGSYFVAGVPVGNGVSLLFSNRAAFLAQYTGDNSVYSTPLLYDNAGLAGPFAATVLGGVVFWMSDKDFWMYNGTVQRLPSDDIRDYVFSTAGGNPGINTSYLSFVAAGTTRAKNEVWWHYPDASNQFNNRYVIYHVDQQCWSIGSNIPRGIWQDSYLFGVPIAVDNSGNVLKQETGTDAASSALDAYLVAGAVDVGNGQPGVDIFGFLPDMERITGDVALSIYTQLYPEDTATTDGPFTLSPDNPGRQDLRSDGKLFAWKLESNALSADFRFGLLRLDVQPSNMRN